MQEPGIRSELSQAVLVGSTRVNAPMSSTVQVYKVPPNAAFADEESHFQRYVTPFVQT